MEKDYSKSSQKLKYSNIEKKIIFLLPIICLVALIIRFYYLPYGIPVIADAFSGYFLYALDISILGYLPNYTLSQSGWSEFLSLFFMNYNSENLIDYMNLQRSISVILSGITIIPIFYICKKFFNNYYSLIGATIFALEPRIIINSTLGISEPLYILAISLGILFFLNLNKKIIYLAFGFFAWATIIRPEGQFWFVAFSIAYLVRFRRKRKDLVMFLVCLAIFLLVLSPIVIHRIQCCDTDGIIGRIFAELSIYQYVSTLEENDETSSFSYGPNFLNGVKLFGWAVIPIFIIFVPLGLIPIFKYFRFPNYLLILVPSVLALPIMYSLSIAPDTRYVYPIFPIFCVISLFGIRWICENFQNKKIVLSIIVIMIVLSSVILLDIKKNDSEREKEMYMISRFLNDKVEGIDVSTEIEKYARPVEIIEKWPNYQPLETRFGNLEGGFKKISPEGFTNIKEFIIDSKDKGLTHLVLDGNSKNYEFLNKIFYNEINYPYLEKIFDSKENELNYHVKIYEINFNELSDEKWMIGE